MEDIDLAKFTQEEEAILRLTEEIWNRFLELPINHPMERMRWQLRYMISRG